METTIMENQMEKNMENEMETEFGLGSLAFTLAGATPRVAPALLFVPRMSTIYDAPSLIMGPSNPSRNSKSAGRPPAFQLFFLGMNRMEVTVIIRKFPGKDRIAPWCFRRCDRI